MAYHNQQGGAPASYPVHSPYSADSFTPNNPPPLPPPKPQSPAVSGYSQHKHQAQAYRTPTGRYTSPQADLGPSAYLSQGQLGRQGQQQQQWHEAFSTTSQKFQGQDVGQNVPYMPTQMQMKLPEEGWVPEALLQKSQPDLQHALTHPEILNALLHSSSTSPPALTASTAPLQPLLSTNIALAQQVKALYGTLASQRERVSTHLLAVRALEHQWKRKQTELEHRLEPWGPRELHQRLGASIVDGERMCKVVEESFLEDATRGDGEVASEREANEWVKRVREGRRLVALRTERRARWDEGRVGGWR